MTNRFDINSYERWRESRTGIDGDALMEGPEIGRETDDLDEDWGNLAPGPWQVAMYVGAVILTMTFGGACILAAIWSRHQ